MKQNKFLFLLFFILFPGVFLSLYSQSVGIGSANFVPDSKSILETRATGLGLLIPRMIWASRPASLSAVQDGLLIYSTDGDGINGKGFYYWDGTLLAWKKLLAGVNGDYVLNQNTIDQVANFRISGNGQINSNLYINSTSNGIVHYGQTGIAGQASGWDPNSLSAYGGIWLECASSEGGGFYADGDMAVIYNPGDVDLLRIYDEDLLPGGNYSAKFDATGNLHSPMLFDLNNTSYYVDPNSISVVNEIGWGNAATRTQTRDDAGAMSGKSGFYETSAPSPASDWPVGTSSWWHLLDIRHSNTANNYALQLAGSFFDQNLYFRKTNNNPAQAWSKILTSADISGTTNYIAKFTSPTSIGNSQIFDDGSMVGVGNILPAYKLDVSGDIRSTGKIWANANGSSYFRGGDDTELWDINEANTIGIYGLQNNDRASIKLGSSGGTISGYLGSIGIGTNTPSSKLHVISDLDNLPVIFGINTNTSAGTNSYGIRGEVNATGLGSAGIYGYSNNSGQNEIGVLGDYQLWGAPVFGLGWAASLTDMPATRDFGVFATVSFPTGTGVWAQNSSSGANAIYGIGNMVITGSKSASVPTSKGNQLLYCMESPELWFEDFGEGQLINGETEIFLDGLFLETVLIDQSHPYKVFIQLEGDSKGVFVSEKLPDRFTVKEIQGGNSDVKFSYRIIAKRRNYQDHRFGVDWNQPLENNAQKNSYIKPYSICPEVTKKWIDEVTKQKQKLHGEKKSSK